MVMNHTDFRFLIYLTRIVYSKYNPYGFILYMIINYRDILKQQQIFKLQPVSHQFLNDSLNESKVCDINNTVIISERVAKSYMRIGTISADQKDSKIKRKVIIIYKDVQSDPNTLLVSDNLFYNLNGAVSCSFKKSSEQTLKFADEVELSLINTPNDWSQFIVDTCLKNYFKTPKLVHKGDVIEVNLKEYGKEIFYRTNKILNVDEIIYFKCSKVICKDVSANDGYFCVIDKSTLKQTTNVQSFIPKLLHDIKEYPVARLLPDALESYFDDMKRAVHPFINKNKLNFVPVFLLEGRKGCGKSLLTQSIALYFGVHLYTINNFDVSANVYAQNETKVRNAFFGAKMAAPCILEIKNFENFGKNNEGQYDERLISHFTAELKTFFENNQYPVILFCCSNEKNIPVELKRIFLKIFEVKAPNEEEREKMLLWIFKENNIDKTINLNNIANKTNGFLFEDLRALVDYAASDFYKDNNNAGCDDLFEDCILKALDFMQSNYNESLGAPKVPKVKWSDVGGLNDVKEEIIKTIKLPLKHPQLLKTTGLKRSGILLFGPPGTGKTLIAKAVATECGLCFLSVKGPELLNMYVGQSEQNVREVFERAREASPCIIFFDELDSLAPNRGASGDSGGVMDRVVSQLLAEMDGLNNSGTIFIIGATNRPDLIDPALLRPGRFDKLLYVGPCTDRDSKIAVLQALTRKFRFSEEVVLDKIVDLCLENFSGADLYGVCSSAWMSAVRRLITSIENGSRKNTSYATMDDVVVSLDDFQFAIKNVKPSIKQEDLEYFHKLKSEFK